MTSRRGAAAALGKRQTCQEATALAHVTVTANRLHILAKLTLGFPRYMTDDVRNSCRLDSALETRSVTSAHGLTAFVLFFVRAFWYGNFINCDGTRHRGKRLETARITALPLHTLAFVGAICHEN